jgi:hypothetical protein
MNKCIIAANGHLKQFQKAVEDNYRVKIADCDQMLQTVIEALGWGGIKDKVYYDFYNQLFKSANEIFDFKNTYIERAIQQFRDDSQSEVLIIKGSNELVLSLEDTEGIFNLFLAKDNDEFIDNLSKYDKVILIDLDFEKNVKQTLDILLKKEKVKV